MIAPATCKIVGWLRRFVHSGPPGCGRQHIGIVGVPFSHGQPRTGVEQGPTAVRETRFTEDLASFGHTVTDHGDIEVDLGSDSGHRTGVVRNSPAVGIINKKLSETVQSVIQDEQVCLTLGGDHSLGIGSVHGHSQVHRDLCLVWVDAHADINTASTTTTGNMHGMPVSFQLRELYQYNHGLPGMEWLKPGLMGKDVVFIALRDVQPLERYILDKLRIKTFSMREIDEVGIIEVVARVLDAVNPKSNRPIHCSFDIDSLDRTVAPSTGTSVSGGLTLREGLCIAEEICKTGLLSALDLVEVNPKIGSPEDCANTLFAAKEIILKFFGGRRGGDPPGELRDIPRLKKD